MIGKMIVGLAAVAIVTGATTMSASAQQKKITASIPKQLCETLTVDTQNWGRQTVQVCGPLGGKNSAAAGGPRKHGAAPVAERGRSLLCETASLGINPLGAPCDRGGDLAARREEQACLPRLLLRALSRLIEQHRRALSRGHLGARSRTSGLAPPTAVGSSPFLTIALRPASGRLDIFITGRMRLLN